VKRDEIRATQIARLNDCFARQRAETKAEGVREYLEERMAKTKSKMPPLEPSSPAPLEPDSPVEWQEAVNCAHFLLLLDAARGYGLVTGGPEVNAVRCTEIVKRGRRMGYKPTARW